MKGAQLPLPVHLPDAVDFDSFHAAGNAAAVAAVQAPLPAGVLLCGASGAGKTHLLQAAAKVQPGGLYLPLRDFAAYGPAAIEGCDEAALCIDDIDAVCTDRDWAQALARRIDQARARGQTLRISAAAGPNHLRGIVPDLRTRLAQCALYTLRLLDDATRAELLIQRARARGLVLSSEVADYLMRRVPRDPASLIALLDALDRASMQARRRLTLPFVQQVLKDSPYGADVAK